MKSFCNRPFYGWYVPLQSKQAIIAETSIPHIMSRKGHPEAGTISGLAVTWGRKKPLYMRALRGCVASKTDFGVLSIGRNISLVTVCKAFN